MSQSASNDNTQGWNNFLIHFTMHFSSQWRSKAAHSDGIAERFKIKQHQKTRKSGQMCYSKTWWCFQHEMFKNWKALLMDYTHKAIDNEAAGAKSSRGKSRVGGVKEKKKINFSHSFDHSMESCYQHVNISSFWRGKCFGSQSSIHKHQ